MMHINITESTGQGPIWTAVDQISSGRRCGKTNLLTELLIAQMVQNALKCSVCQDRLVFLHGIIIDYKEKKLGRVDLGQHDHVICDPCFTFMEIELPGLFSRALRDLPPHINHRNSIIRDITRYRLKEGI